MSRSDRNPQRIADRENESRARPGFEPLPRPVLEGAWPALLPAQDDQGRILLHAEFEGGTTGLLLATPERILLFEDGFETGDTPTWASGTL